LPKQEFVRKETTLLFQGKASDFGEFSKILLRHRELVNHQVMIVSSGILAAGAYKVRFIPANDETVESSIDSGEVLTITAKDSAYATFVGMIKGIHLEVDTPLSGGETISAVITSYTKVYPEETSYISTLVKDSIASDVGQFSVAPIQHRGMLYHQISLASSGILAAGVYGVRLIPDIDETLETSVDIEVSLDVTGKDSAIAQFIGVAKGFHLKPSTPFTAGETMSVILSSGSEEFDTVILAAIGGTTDHTMLTNIGSNTHVQIDTHIADSTIHFTEGSIDHTNIQNIGTNSHAQIDTHIADGTIHFTEGSIDHTNIQNIGTNSHAQIDSHIAIAVTAASVFGADTRVLVADGAVRGAKYSPVTIDSNGNMNNVKSIQLDLLATPPAHSQGLLWYDANGHSVVVYLEETDVTQQLGREMFMYVYNDTLSTIPDGKCVSVMHVNGDGVPHVELTDCTDKDSALGYVGLTTHSLEAGTYGEVTVSGFVNNLNTIALTAGAVIWCSETTPGEVQETRPTSPNWEVRVGGVAKSHATEGMLYSEPRIMHNWQDTLKYFNGSVLESNNVFVTSDGVTATCELKHSDGSSNLSFLFSQEFVTLTAPYTVALTAGTDTVPQRNYVYIPESTKVLTANTTGYPTSEQFVPVADIMVQSAASALADGFYKVHAWTDHLADSNGQGHLSHINSWIRARPAGWKSGVVLTPSVAEGTPAASIDLAYTSGTVYQLHLHTYDSFDSAASDIFYVINDPVTPYKEISSLNNTDISQDSTGGSLTNKNYSIVLWGVISQEAKDCQMFINLPSGFYNTESGAIADASSYSDYSIPSEYAGTGFLITRLVLSNQGANIKIVDGGTFDLRGTVPAATGGGVSGGAGVTLFTQLLDTPNAYTTFGSALLRVNSGESGLEASGIKDLTSGIGSTAITANDDGIVFGAISSGATYRLSSVSNSHLELRGGNTSAGAKLILGASNLTSNPYDIEFETNSVNRAIFDYSANAWQFTSAYVDMVVTGGQDLGIRLKDVGLFPFNSTWGSGDPTFQNRTTNNSTTLRVIPNGTSVLSQFEFFGNDYYADTVNWHNFRILSSADGFTLDTNSGTGGTVNAGWMKFETESDAEVVNTNQLFLATDGAIGLSTDSPDFPLHIVQEGNGSLTYERYQSSVQGVSFICRKARGDSTTPTATLADDRIAQFNGFGYGATQFSVSATAWMRFYSDATFTDTSNPTAVAFGTTPVDSIAATERMRIDPDGNVGIGVAAPKARLHVRKSDLTITATFNDSYIAVFEGYTATNAYISMVGDANKNVGFRFGGVAKLDKAMVFWDDTNENVTIRTHDGTGNVDGFEVDKDGGVVVDGTATGHSKGLGTINIKDKIYFNGGIMVAHGSGTPEGALTAPVGSTFHRSDGGAGTSYYVKESGTGNTGWVGK
jgi:hypothetical protein